MRPLPAAFLALALAASPAAAGQIDDFSGTPAARWAFFSDRVMGGRSSGGVSFEGGALHLTGTVSTANNGGFVQARLKLPDGLPRDAKAIVLRVRGNGDRYYIHLRTTGTLLPWQYYQASFTTGPSWQEVRLRLESFKPSSRVLRKVPRPDTVRSLAVVAFGHDHQADLWVDSIGWE